MHINLQRIIPQHLITRIIGKLAEMKALPWLKNWAIKQFIAAYGVNMAEAKQEDYTQFASFNDFFTRHLKPSARAQADGIICPVDGCVSEIGVMQNDQILQAKDHYYSTQALLGGNKELAAHFDNGNFATLYLAPKDYHRIHMPVAGRLLEMHHVPGELFSVNPYTANNLEGLFARNERVVAIFETELGKMAMIAVGAVIVGSIAVSWHGVVTPPTCKTITTWDYSEQNITLEKGDEFGYFKLGSTVIVLFEQNEITWDQSLKAGVTVQMGQAFTEAKQP